MEAATEIPTPKPNGKKLGTPTETAFHVKLSEIRVDDKGNVRQTQSYDTPSTILGEEEAGLENLAESLKTRGQLQPCGVVADGDRGYRLIFGFRRYHAAKLAGLDTLFVTVFPSENATEVTVAQLAENISRKRLNAYETGKGVNTLLKAGMKPNEVAKAIGLVKGSVSNYKLIFEKIAPPILEAWEKEPGTIKVSWLLSIRELPVTEQLERLKALSSGAKPAAKQAESGTETEAEEEPSETKKRMAKRHEVQMWLGFLREGRFATRGADWVAGATQALEMVVGDGDMPPPDAPNPNEAAGELPSPKKKTKH